MIMAGYTFIKDIMEQNNVTYDELHGVISQLVQKVESLEDYIHSIVKPTVKDELLGTLALAKYLGKSRTTVYRIIVNCLYVVPKFT